MRVLAFTRESYPSSYSTSYILMHQSMALEELGHEVHYYNPDKHPLGLTDYLHSFDFDLIFLDLEFLRSLPLLRILAQYRRIEPVRVVGALYRLPAPTGPVWEITDFTITPWKGETISALAQNYDLRYLPLAYNARLHQRKTGHIGGSVFVGDTTGEKQQEADAYLAELTNDHCISCAGPGFADKFIDPFALGHVYASSRCLPNFHYSWEKSGDCILNERFWQTARCGIPVNDYSPLMTEILDKSLLEQFCFADKHHWQDRVRALQSGSESVHPTTIQELSDALNGHGYHDRMKQLLDWIL
jgi:hypothetical protein